MPSDQLIPVSVIIPCYRCRDTVARALDSALSQTFPPEEILLIDDASGDGSLAFLRGLEERHRPRVRVIALNENGGPGLARNAGWEAATQPWIAFLDADDAWHPRKLEIQWAWLAAHQDAVLCGHASEFAADGIIDSPVEAHPQATRLSTGKMLVSNRLPTRSVMLRRELPFRFSDRRYSEDYSLWMEIIMAGYPVYRLQSTLAFCFRPDFSPGGLSGSLWIHEKNELAVLKTLREKNGMPWATWVWASMWSVVKFLRRLWLVRSI